MNLTVQVLEAKRGPSLCLAHCHVGIRIFFFTWNFLKKFIFVCVCPCEFMCNTCMHVGSLGGQ